MRQGPAAASPSIACHQCRAVVVLQPFVSDPPALSWLSSGRWPCYWQPCSCHLSLCLRPGDVCRCFFGDFTDKAEEPTDRRYTEIPSVSTALAAVEEALADYNGTSKRPMHLAMFLYALEHVSRISRLMKQPGGHMLLIGVGGSGRQSLAKLAAFMAGVELFQVRPPLVEPALSEV